MSHTKVIPHNLIQWDQSDNSLAPLTECQKDCLTNLEIIVSSFFPLSNLQSSTNDGDDKLQEQKSQENIPPIEKYQELLDYFLCLERKYVSMYDMKYSLYLDELKSRKSECQDVCSQIEETLDDFSALYKQYTEVSSKTTSLYEASEQLIFDQKQLNATIDGITDYVKYFKEIDVITEKLDASTLSVNSEMFFTVLDKIDTNIDFMQNNSSYNESGIYLVRYKHCQSKAIALIQNYISNLFSKTTESILNLKDNENSSENADTALALFYGRFQTILSKTRPVIRQIENKSYKRQEYDTLLLECHQYYWSQRGLVLGTSIQKSLNFIREKYNGDHCSLVRHSCALLLHASIDEHKLFYEFFSKQSNGLTAYLESLCTSLYDALRPFIIHINHLETLAEICCILRIEMLDEHVQNNFEPLEGFGNICLQLLHDVQERLVFRAHLYLQSDVLDYNPSSGDLAYPEKLKMMEDIAESIREATRQTRIKKISVSSTDTDLHAMWYPTVRRTLVCLSRLYRCVDRSVFQSLSQEAISLCVQSIENARQEIEKRASTLDAELFQIKHLLILREQIAPFQVDFTIKEYSLDFSKVKTAAFGLLEKSSRFFTLSNNALLQFLLEGAPQMKEQLIDSRKHVDAKLRLTCQRLIQHATYLLIYPIIKLLEKEKLLDANSNQENALGSPQEIATIVADVLRIIKFKCPEIQQSMQLYLANKETEFILFKPVKNNICAAFTQLHQTLNKYYNAENLLLIACPLPEQISVMLSSTTLIQGKSNRESQSVLKQS
ncbi:Conserved oligomeric Golgi complex subunit 3 [Trachymyrmex septentrionalis]|uniref:Conserved oligomeric Golgi complex subunit 3 n=1 Tax=Trachymyrmex septentrionalis TaxID=34720 RepID=A0A151JST8_9HYME|nr:Conserved oligomeric Golgi complex subunit 3 [Trachymyrmex septentrionalis]